MMRKHPNAKPSIVRRLAITVHGVVQGVGLRPFIYNAARAARLSGWVANRSDNVRIEVQGPTDALDAFVDALRNCHPPQAKIDAIDLSKTACRDDPAEMFCIRASVDTGTAVAPRPTIPADLATCEECLKEIFDPAARRYKYPFTNCTNCGPRWSIIHALPYDRPRTSMARFTMCPDCRAEYENPADRRFHAQPIACPRCGPTLKLLDNHGKETAVGPAALDAAAEAVLAGRIVAIKGLGGFQLLADATNAEAVAELRRRKQRPDRPFALMMPSLDEVRRRCEVSEKEALALASTESPIMLLRSCEPSHQPSPKGRGGFIATAVAPSNPYLGVMLPYTPLHHLLMAAICRPIICTSGNLAEEPMAITTEEAIERLGAIADVLLTHDRPIVRPVDDSIVRIFSDGVQLLRRARGYAPLPIGLGFPCPTVLAVGGHLKNTVALALGRVRETHHAQVILSPHVGDLIHVRSVEVHRRAVCDLVEFFEATPDVVACDLHPDYASTRYAEALSAEWEVPLVRVQHHHAHVAACMAEHRLEDKVLGFAWDGTGYGADGTVWGGEAILCEGAEFTRVGHLRTFALPGGEKAAEEPRRSALGLLFEIMGDDATKYAAGWFKPAELNALLSLLNKKVNSPRTSSMGRLFDAVAALCGLLRLSSFEGQAAMALEFAADKDETDAYPLPISADTPAVADWEPLIRAVLADLDSGVPIGRIGGRFHNALADMALSAAKSVGYEQIVLSGGCFQNAILTERVRASLSKAGFLVYTHRQVPPGDGGIALGQLAVAAWKNTWPLAASQPVTEQKHVSRHPG